MKIAIYTLTRDRLEYTKHCFQMLYEKAGYPFDHFVLDNGSADGTVMYLIDMFFKKKTIIHFSKENIGISVGSNYLLDEITSMNYDIIIKFDNDCEVVTDGILKSIVNFYEKHDENKKYIISPKVNGIINQPHRGWSKEIFGFNFGATAIVGGLFHVVPVEIYKQYRYPTDLKPGWGQDDHFCDWAKKQGYEVGYLEDLEVNHYETTSGQLKRYPEYFNRKKEENK